MWVGIVVLGGTGLLGRGLQLLPLRLAGIMIRLLPVLGQGSASAAVID